MTYAYPIKKFKCKGCEKIMAEYRGNKVVDTTWIKEGATLTKENATYLREITRIIPQANTVFNLAGFTPTASQFKLTEAQIKSSLLMACKKFISDFTEVTLSLDHRDGTLTAYVWISEESPQICDTSLRETNAVIKTSITKYSGELQKFMDRFGFDKEKRFVLAGNNLPLKSLKIDIVKLFRVIYDDTGREFSNIVGGRQINTTINLKLECYEGSSRESHYDSIKYLSIEKVHIGSADVHPEPRRNANIH